MQDFIGDRAQQRTAQRAGAAGTHHDQIARVAFQDVDQGVRRVARGDFALEVDVGLGQQRLRHLQRVSARAGADALQHQRIVRHHQFIQIGRFLNIGQHHPGLQAGMRHANGKADCLQRNSGPINWQ